MPKYVATGTLAPGLKVGGSDLSDHVRSIDVQMTAADVDITAMGAVSLEHAPGLRDDRFTITFFQDFDASKVDAVLSPLIGVAAGTTVVAYAHGVTASSTAPSYTMVGVLLDYHPIALGAPGEASQTPVTFVPAPGSYITRATT